MLETRHAKLQATHREGQGCGNTFRINLPTRWIRLMALGETQREVELQYDTEQQIIRIKKAGQS